MALNNIFFYCDDDDVELFYDRYRHFFEDNILLFSTNPYTISFLMSKENAISEVKKGFSHADKILMKISSCKVTNTERNIIEQGVKNNICSRAVLYDQQHTKRFIFHCARRVNFIQKYLSNKNIDTVVVTDHIYSPALDFCIAALRLGCKLLIRTQPYRSDYAKSFKTIDHLDQLYEHPWQINQQNADILVQNLISSTNNVAQTQEDIGGVMIACHRLNDMNLLYSGDWFFDYVDWLDKTLSICKDYFPNQRIFVRPHPTEGQRHYIDQIMSKHDISSSQIMDSSVLDWKMVAEKKLLVITIRGTIFLEALGKKVPAITTSRTRFTNFGEALFGKNPEQFMTPDLHTIFREKKITSVSELQQSLALNIEKFEANSLQIEYIR